MCCFVGGLSIYRSFSSKLSGVSFFFTLGGNIVLSTMFADDVSLSKVKQLVNGLVYVLGTDDNGEGRFTSVDIDNYRDGFYSKMWLDATKYEYPVLLSRDDNELSLTIIGL